MAVQMHKAKKRENKTKKQKSRYDISGLATAIHPPPRQHLKYKRFKSDDSKNETVHQRRHRPT
jgi:hypothetical protein